MLDVKPKDRIWEIDRRGVRDPWQEPSEKRRKAPGRPAVTMARPSFTGKAPPAEQFEGQVFGVRRDVPTYLARKSRVGAAGPAEKADASIELPAKQRGSKSAVARSILQRNPKLASA